MGSSSSRLLLKGTRGAVLLDMDREGSVRDAAAALGFAIGFIAWRYRIQITTLRNEFFGVGDPATAAAAAGAVAAAADPLHLRDYSNGKPAPSER